MLCGMQAVLGDVERARAIYELAVNQPLLDMPEVLWKAYIDFETEINEFENARELYERLLKKTSHVKVSSRPSAPTVRWSRLREQQGVCTPYTFCVWMAAVDGCSAVTQHLTSTLSVGGD